MKKLALALLAFVLTAIATPSFANTCPSFPFNLQNGQRADATQVMANFNNLLTCLNGNVATAGANTNITSLGGLTTPLSASQGGTGFTSIAALSAAQFAAQPAFTGDTGSGGVKGYVPAPAAGDGAAGKILGAGGGWVLPYVPPTGAIMQCAASTPPTGWLEMNGAAVSRTTFAALFAVIGTTYGVGDGTTTFNLPDSRGEFLRGWDHGAGIDPSRTFGSTQADAFASHTHTVDLAPLSPLTGSGNGNVASGTSTQAGSLVRTTAATGGTETRPKNVAILMIIKT